MNPCNLHGQKIFSERVPTSRLHITQINMPQPRQSTGIGHICMLLMMQAALQTKPRFRISPPGIPVDMTSSTFSQDNVHRHSFPLEHIAFPQLRTKKSNIPDAGLGVFAVDPILGGHFLTEYGGDLVDWRKAKDLWCTVGSYKSCARMSLN